MSREKDFHQDEDNDLVYRSDDHNGRRNKRSKLFHKPPGPQSEHTGTTSGHRIFQRSGDRIQKQRIGRREAQIFLSYNGGVLEIDDDFLNYSEGIYTALVDSDNNLLYGELPVRLDSDEAFSYTAVGMIKADGEKFYVYEKQLSGNNLEGLWLRGFVSERESANVLYNMVRLSVWLIPVIAAAALVGGYVITRRSFLPIGAIDSAAREIADSRDLTKRIDIGGHDNGHMTKDRNGKDEIQNLAQTFNEMFDRLEDSFNAEKQFTSDASHELRTPLSVIKANCQYALKFAEGEDDFRESLKAIEDQADRASVLLSQLLFFARLDQKQGRVHFDSVDLSKIVSYHARIERSCFLAALV